MKIHKEPLNGGFFYNKKKTRKTNLGLKIVIHLNLKFLDTITKKNNSKKLCVFIIIKILYIQIFEKGKNYTLLTVLLTQGVAQLAYDHGLLPKVEGLKLCYTLRPHGIYLAPLVPEGISLGHPPIN